MDCLEGMKMIPDESVDLVVTDCPYHIVSGGCSTGAFNCMRGILNKGAGEVNPSEEESSNYQNMKAGKIFEHNDIEFSEWLPDVYRILKESGHCYIMINARNLKDLQTEAEKVGFVFQQLLVWRKNSATPNRYYMNQLEFILMLRKGAAKDINDMSFSNCLSCPNIIGKDKLNMHPTAKPIPLMQILIKQSSNEGQLVLDPFAGGGSTLIAAKRLDRKYIGFEIDPKYYDIASKALANTEYQLNLF